MPNIVIESVQEVDFKYSLSNRGNKELVDALLEFSIIDGESEEGEVVKTFIDEVERLEHGEELKRNKIKDIDLDAGSYLVVMQLITSEGEIYPIASSGFRVKIRANEIPIFYGNNLYLDYNGADEVSVQNSLSRFQFEKYYPDKRWLGTQHHINNNYFLNHDFDSLGVDTSRYSGGQEVYLFHSSWNPSQAAQLTGDPRELDLAHITRNISQHENGIFFSQDNFDLTGVDRLVGDPTNPAVIVLQNKLDLNHYIEVENVYFIVPHGMNINGGILGRNTVIYSLSDISIGGTIDGENQFFDFEGYIIAGQSNVRFSIRDTSTIDGTISLNPDTPEDLPNVRISERVDFNRLPSGIFGEYRPVDFMELFKPEVDNSVRVYYKRGFDNPYIHYAPEGGDWTAVPGVLMEES